MTEEVILLDRQTSKDHIIDLFCGGGGSGTGILQAYDLLDRKPRGTFVNHWDKAIDIHSANYPEHRHLIEDLSRLNPQDVFTEPTYVSLFWASPECVHFSLARGDKPMNEQSRSGAMCVVGWIKHTRPDIALIENVREFEGWGDLEQKADPDHGLIWSKDGKQYASREVVFDVKPIKLPKYFLPTELRRRPKEYKGVWRKRVMEAGYDAALTPKKSRKGCRHRVWVRKIQRFGYTYDRRIVCSADFGDPTTRRRLFMQFVRIGSGKQIVWPAPTHAKPDADGNVPKGLRPWRTAREIIDWSNRGESIFRRKRPLSPKTLRRIAIGLARYGLKNFLVPQHQGHKKDNVRSEDDPVSTLTTNHRGEGLAQPYLVHMHGQSTAHSVDEPISGMVGGFKHYAINPNLVKLKGTGTAKSVDLPLDVVGAQGLHHALVTAFMIATDQTGGNGSQVYSTDDPVHTTVTKANQAIGQVDMIPFKPLEENLDPFLVQTAHGDKGGVDPSRVKDLLTPLSAVCGNRGDLAIVRPWIYTYYSSGSVGANIDDPLPTSRTHESMGVCYPVIEFDGQFYLLDIYFRMLSPTELARAQGFPDDYKWPGTKTEQVRAIGNSVTCGVARALSLAALTQNPDVSAGLKYEFITDTTGG